MRQVGGVCFEHNYCSFLQRYMMTKILRLEGCTGTPTVVQSYTVAAIRATRPGQTVDICSFGPWVERLLISSTHLCGIVRTIVITLLS